MALGFKFELMRVVLCKSPNLGPLGESLSWLGKPTVHIVSSDLRSFLYLELQSSPVHNWEVFSAQMGCEQLDLCFLLSWNCGGPTCSSGKLRWGQEAIGEWGGSSFGQCQRGGRDTSGNQREIPFQRTQVTANGTTNLMVKFVVKHHWGFSKAWPSHFHSFTLRPGFCQHLNTNCWNCWNITGEFSVMDWLRLTQSVMGKRAGHRTPAAKDTAPVVVQMRMALLSSYVWMCGLQLVAVRGFKRLTVFWVSFLSSYLQIKMWTLSAGPAMMPSLHHRGLSPSEATSQIKCFLL